MRIVSQKEAKELDFNPAYGKYGLLDTVKKSLFFTSNSAQDCVNTLNRMTPQHPKYNDMELVQAPDKV